MKIDWSQIHKLYEDEWQTQASIRWSKHVKLAEKEAAQFIKRADISTNSEFREAFIIGYRNGSNAQMGDASEYIEKKLAALKRLSAYVLDKYEMLEHKEKNLKTIQRNTSYELDQIQQLRGQLAKEDFALRLCKKALLKNFTIKQIE